MHWVTVGSVSFSIIFWEWILHVTTFNGTRFMQLVVHDRETIAKILYEIGMLTALKSQIYFLSMVLMNREVAMRKLKLVRNVPSNTFVSMTCQLMQTPAMRLRNVICFDHSRMVSSFTCSSTLWWYNVGSCHSIRSALCHWWYMKPFFKEAHICWDPMEWMQREESDRQKLKRRFGS